MSIKSEPAANETLYEAYGFDCQRPGYPVGGSLAQAFSAQDELCDLSDFDALLRQLDALPDIPEARA